MKPFQRGSQRAYLAAQAHALPPAFLLPFRAHISSSPQFVEPGPPPTKPLPADGLKKLPSRWINQSPENLDNPLQTAKGSSLPSPSHVANTQSSQVSGRQELSTSESLTSIPSAQSPLGTSLTPVPTEVLAMLPLLAAQTPHYATIHIHARPYLVTQGDVVRLPFRMPNVQLGDVLRLTCLSIIGSRDYTLRGGAKHGEGGSVWRDIRLSKRGYIDQRLFTCRAVVSSVESEPLRIELKTKRRNRKVKRVKSKHRYTEIVIKELNLQNPEDVPKDGLIRAYGGEDLEISRKGEES